MIFHKFKRKLIALISFLILLHCSVSPAIAQTQRWEDMNLDCTINGVATIQGTMCLLANVFSVALTLLGIAGFVMLVFGSLTWMLSGSNTQGVDNAKKTITFAFIGLILALSSFIIINLIAQFTGVNVIKEFFIPSSDTGLPGGPSWDDVINPP